MDEVSTDGSRRRWRMLAILAVGAGAVVGSEQSQAVDSSVASVVVPVTPFRVLDTRQGIGTGGVVGAVGADSTITLQVAGVGTVPADATGVVLNLTASGGTAAGYVTAYPTGKQRPEASVLNITPGQDLPNMITASLGDGGRLDLYNFAGSVHLIADVAAYLVAAGTGGGAPGPQGAQGAQGPQGLQGPRGFSAWDTIPSGVTVTGGFAYDTEGSPAAGAAALFVALPAVAPVALIPGDVRFGAVGPSSDESPLCNGTDLVPTAPPGMVCVYLRGYTAGLTNATGFTGPRPTSGFIIDLFSNGSSDLAANGSWAYTAP